MKRIIFLLIPVYIFMSASGCGGSKVTPDPQPEKTLAVDVQELVFSNAADTKTITVVANCDWGVSSNDKDWLTVSPSGGTEGRSTIRVSVTENKASQARSTSISFRFAGKKLDIPVRQNYKVEAAAISDPNFVKALLKSYDEDGDGILSTVEAAKVTRIEAKGYGIKAMPELNTLFKDAVYLDCSDNQLSELDITNLVKLEYLDCRGNANLKTINVWSGFKAGDKFLKPEGAQWQEPSIPTPAGYTLVWQDEFNEGNIPDVKKWTHEVKNAGWVNHELQNYVSGKSPKGTRVSEVKDGALHINCFKEDGKIYSARIYGNVSAGWKYAYVEASINLPSGKGTWPAFWMMPVHFTSWPHDGEIDIMEEVGYHKDYVSSSLHADGHVHSNNTQVTKEVYCKGAEGEFHTYGMEWTPDYFQFYVDGQKTLYYKNPGTGVRDWPYDAPFYVILNLAWGGDWGGSQGVDESKLPVTMKVDYVRVFQKL
ncbi:MAG: family 16 glycosylhydrolase [Bacteroidales bacterium]|nr:family 16 glycosylhydrolase [Bacteroidales bacterium]